MTDGSRSSHGSGGTIERGDGEHGHRDPADRPAPPALPAGAPLWTPDEVRAAVASAIAHGQSWIAAWGAAWLVRRGHEIDGATIAWLCGHAAPEALAAMFSRFERGAESRRQPEIARAIAAELASLEERQPDAAIVAEMALAAHLDTLDDPLVDLIERRHWHSIQSFVPALARIRDPRAGALLFRLARSEHDTELRCDALVALARRGDADAVAAAAPELLALCDEDAEIEGSVPYELTQSILEILELRPLRERLRPFLYGADSGGAVSIRAAVTSLVAGCDPETARRLAAAFPPRAAEKVHRSFLTGNAAAAWKVLIPCARRAAEIAAAESPRFAAEARAIGTLLDAIGAHVSLGGIMEEEQDGLCVALALLIGHLVRAHRVDEEIAAAEIAPGEARALLLADQPWVAGTTLARARELLSPEEIAELAERPSIFARRNARITRALAAPAEGIAPLLAADLEEITEPPLRGSLAACADHLGEDALPELARLHEEEDGSDLALEALHDASARIGTERARAAVRAVADRSALPREPLPAMVLVAMDLRDPERAHAIVESLSADPAACLRVDHSTDAILDAEVIRSALAEMLELVGAAGEVEPAALAAIAARTCEAIATMPVIARMLEREAAELLSGDALDEDEGIEGVDDLDAIAADDGLWESFDSDPEGDAAIERLARRLPPESARGREPSRERAALDRLGAFAGLREHDESCGPGCGHSHHAPVHPLHAAAKVGRNDLCPCGSGRKHKRCCGK